jgi:hypothetical protein
MPPVSSASYPAARRLYECFEKLDIISTLYGWGVTPNGASFGGDRPPGSDALIAAGVDERHLFGDRVSGSRGDRAGLAKALAFIKSGDDCLVVWKLDRLGRSLPHLLTTVR